MTQAPGVALNSLPTLQNPPGYSCLKETTFQDEVEPEL